MKPFEEFQALPKEAVDEIWKRGLVSLDANVLLDLYYLSASSRQQLLDFLGSLDDGRLWVSHQALLEFHRQRVGRRMEVTNAFKRVSADVQRSASELKKVLDSHMVGETLYDQLEAR